MNFRIWLFCALLLYSPFVLGRYSTEPATRIMEVVVEVSHFNALKHLPAIENALNEVSEQSGVKLICPDKGWLVIEINLHQIANAEQLEAILKTSGIHCIVKTNATRKEVIEACQGDLIKQ